MDIEDKQKAMLADDLTAYINEKHNQDKCTGFIEGYNAALSNVKTLGLFSVSQQRKLLITFLEMNNWLSLKDEENAKGVVDCYLKAINCG